MDTQQLYEALLGVYRGFAAVFLSPWLYLLMAGVFVAERLIPVDRHQRLLSRGAVHDFLAWSGFEGMLRMAMDVALLGLLYAFYDSYLAPLRIPLAAQMPVYMQIAAAIVVGDLALWWHHFLMHKVKFLWAFHSVHHSQSELNMFTNSRFHIGDVLVSRIIRYTPLYLLSLDIEFAVWIPVLIESYERVYHANLRSGYGPLKYLLVTPQSHRIHHSADPRHRDKNFGILFSCWDRLFGTQWTGYDEYPGTGIADEGFPAEQSARSYNVFSIYFAQFVYPFAYLARRWRRADADHWESSRAEV